MLCPQKTLSLSAGKDKMALYMRNYCLPGGQWEHIALQPLAGMEIEVKVYGGQSILALNRA
ncbi:hypothetical protein KDH_03670 [Dictyobacter sp. S3.2.2.5]|uniref:Uncharacterized protein n=1 Tax=Dictyobacter halimunensis TaxID=3026934 RepID=A0ABQ6FLU1_9CHLR|nr:hypothetical protein KDH_03670 [Dictyobacter sp. S3.2.2.5]